MLQYGPPDNELEGFVDVFVGHFVAERGEVLLQLLNHLVRETQLRDAEGQVTPLLIRLARPGRTQKTVDN